MENEKRINDFFSKIKIENPNSFDSVYIELITFERNENLKNMKDEYDISCRTLPLEEALLVPKVLRSKQSDNIDILGILKNANYDFEKFYQVVESRINEEQNRVLSGSQNDKYFEIKELKNLSIVISMLKKYKKLRDILLIRAYNFGDVKESYINLSSSPAIHINVYSN